MDANITKALNDKLYDKRKSGALELEGLIRDCLAAQDHAKIQRIVHQLCHEYAYAVHQPHARNGGLIGLAAASIALGPEVARYLKEIVPPVLACFSDQDARVRYYACESMYNIAKVAKGEILVYFNQVFDALCKLAADSELSVKNGAELLDRLVKDIVAESAASYVSILHTPSEAEGQGEGGDGDQGRVTAESPTAFSLERFLPLLEERINVLNPFTRTFLVAWISLLDSIPDLELVTHLPRFLRGLFKFLSDPNPDVKTATHKILERFLNEIRSIAGVKRGVAESRRSGGDEGAKTSASSLRTGNEEESEANSTIPGQDVAAGEKDSESAVTEATESDDDERSTRVDDDWIPGQDVQVDHAKILDILVSFLGETREDEKEAQKEIQVTALRWINSFFQICPEDIMTFVPRLLTHVLPMLSHDIDQVRIAANNVNTSLMAYIMSLSDDDYRLEPGSDGPLQLFNPMSGLNKDLTGGERRDSNFSPRISKIASADSKDTKGTRTPTPAEDRPSSPPAKPLPEVDYQGAVNALTLQFLNEHEDTRVAAIQWLIMLHKMAPGKILSIDDGTFPALLKTLSDPSEAVVTRDLHLLSQISKNSDDSYFTSFMVNLLKLFCTDRRLLETRGNLIIRQLCVSLSPERIYRTMADCLEKDEDVEFASIMVQNLNNNLITAPELADLRKRLRNLDNRDGQTFFVTLFKSWCHNAVATFSLCLLAQAYEQAYHLLQIFADLEMTVDMLIQIDKLVQLLESPVFTYLRMQLLEPERYPHLYKCLYGLLMLLPQSSAFAALKNRLNSVSAIGYLHIAPRTYVPSSNFNHLRQKSSDAGTPSSQTGPSAPSFERSNRLKSRDEGGVKWVELLDKFKTIQERARRSHRLATLGEDAASAEQEPESIPPEVPPKNIPIRPSPTPGGVRPSPLQQVQAHKPKSSLTDFGRRFGGVAGRKKK
ncbi:ARM repeat-containing protein [Westerdykella ornata]|uniref:ARM repeat-containing protein n=1 Tax=Westerdykella ornata TaxID=318751 RepID=A0A6A6JE61_WESOR|nr:ARM repeat-containing protein [Westerdykella ornata]KAF2273946.1 ARM repeat-containing protein [Westerdykella ornata]